MERADRRREGSPLPRGPGHWTRRRCGLRIAGQSSQDAPRGGERFFLRRRRQLLPVGHAVPPGRATREAARILFAARCPGRSEVRLPAAIASNPDSRSGQPRCWTMPGPRGGSAPTAHRFPARAIACRMPPRDGESPPSRGTSARHQNALSMWSAMAHSWHTTVPKRPQMSAITSKNELTSVLYLFVLKSINLFMFEVVCAAGSLLKTVVGESLPWVRIPPLPPLVSLRP